MSTTLGHTKKSQFTYEDKLKMMSEMKESKAREPFDDCWRDQHGFNTVSLGDYLDLCRQTGVKYVPAARVGSIDIGILLQDEPWNDVHFKRLADAVHRHKKPGSILRWDCCSPMVVKSNMSRGLSHWSQDLLDGFEVVLQNDPRAYELVYQYPGRKMIVWRRPWHESVIKDGYPLEYRAYVENGNIKGVSNYYMQRDLLWDDEIRKDVHSVISSTQMLIEAMPDLLKYPFCTNIKEFPRDKKNFCVDFMKTEKDMLFLEGGPPMDGGADPCCFAEDHDNYFNVSYLGVRVALWTSDEIKEKKAATWQI